MILFKALFYWFYEKISDIKNFLYDNTDQQVNIKSVLSSAFLSSLIITLNISVLLSFYFNWFKVFSFLWIPVVVIHAFIILMEDDFQAKYMKYERGPIDKLIPWYIIGSILIIFIIG